MRDKRYKEALLSTINKAEEGNKISRWFDVFIMTLIVLNVVAVIIETVEGIYLKYQFYFDVFEYFSVIIFTIEYFMRLWACTAKEKYAHPVWGRIRYIFSIEALIDLMAILPFYLPLFFDMDMRVIRLLRLFRLLRIFKLGRYSIAFIMIVKVIERRKEELMITLTLVLVLMILSSSLMYYIEHEVQPEAFTSIPATMWWSVATLTTVGYGDVYPVTPLGKVLAAFIAILGIGIFALPAGILAAGFESEISKREKNRSKNKRKE